jgi:threonyl-tRNA synthetase
MAASVPAKKVQELKESPHFINERLLMWDRLKLERNDWIAAQPRDPITITLPDGKEIPGTSWSTTPYEIASGISKGLADNCVVAKVDGEEWDLDRPFEKSAELKLVKVKILIWHLFDLESHFFSLPSYIPVCCIYYILKYHFVL